MRCVLLALNHQLLKQDGTKFDCSMKSIRKLLGTNINLVPQVSQSLDSTSSNVAAFDSLKFDGRDIMLSKRNGMECVDIDVY